MLFSTLVFATMAAASSVVQRQVTSEFAPWKITSLFSYKPSGQPSPNTNSSIVVRITDPNDITLMRASRFGYGYLASITADCDIEWEFPTGQPPYGEEKICSGGDASGNFSVTLVEGTGELEPVLDFGLKFTETRETRILNNYFERKFEGTASFKTGQNYQGSCGDAGVCAGQLDGDVEVQQELTESVGSCEEYGGC